MINGDKCPICEKGKLKKTKDEVEPGVYVEAFKCSKCKEIFYSEVIMKNIESLRKSNSQARKIVKIGNSYAAIIPSDIIKRLSIKEKETIYVEEKKGKIIIAPSVR